jgi:signal peptidase I
MRRWKKALLALALVLGGLVLLTLLTSTLYRIPSSSMESTFHCARPASGCEADTMDRIIVSRLWYRLRDPEPGDVVAFRVPEAGIVACSGGLPGEEQVFISRLIAGPGDRWREQNGFIFVNGERLDEPYVEPERRDQDTIQEKTVPAGEYLVLGDNRSQSCDSRRWGTVPRENLIGPVNAVYWPPGRIGFR